eukprot:1169894-Amphidinium_carterae.1
MAHCPGRLGRRDVLCLGQKARTYRMKPPHVENSQNAERCTLYQEADKTQLLLWVGFSVWCFMTEKDKPTTNTIENGRKTLSSKSFGIYKKTGKWSKMVSTKVFSDQFQSFCCVLN